MRINLYQKVVDCKIGTGTVLRHFINLYGCSIGRNCMIGTFVEIQKGVVIGNNVRVQSHSFICEGVTIEDDVFIGHGVMFINDNHPRANTPWKLLPVKVNEGASIGTNATILGGVTIGERALVGAGSVVTKNVLPYSIVVGNPAQVIGKVKI